MVHFLLKGTTENASKWLKILEPDLKVRQCFQCDNVEAAAENESCGFL